MSRKFFVTTLLHLSRFPTKYHILAWLHVYSILAFFVGIVHKFYYSCTLVAQHTINIYIYKQSWPLKEVEQTIHNDGIIDKKVTAYEFCQNAFFLKNFPRIISFHYLVFSNS
jgi:hypothetical protein